MIKIKDIMSKKVMTIDMNAKAIDAAKRMAGKPASCLIVVKNNEPVGIISERDLVREIIVPEKNPEKIRISEIMTANIPTITTKHSFFDVVKLMKQKHCRRFPVVQGRKVVGLITETDVINAVVNSEEELNAKLSNRRITTKDFAKKQKELVTQLKEVRDLYKKLDTGIPSLNDLTGGGFQIGGNFLIEGPTSFEKRFITYSYLAKGLMEGDTCIYVYSNQTIEDIGRDFGSVGIDLPKYLKRKQIVLIDVINKVCIPTKGSVICKFEDLYSITNSINEIVENSRSNVRCVINIISQALMFWKLSTIYRFIFDLTEYVRSKKITTLYSIETGMHDLKEVTAMEQLMEGVMEIVIKEEKTKVKKYFFTKKMEGQPLINQTYTRFDYDKDKGIVLRR